MPSPRRSGRSSNRCATTVTPAVLPDFVLTDTDPATMVEVWGMLDRDDYTARKRAKIIHYRSTDTPLIEWDVRDRLPDLRLPRYPGR